VVYGYTSVFLNGISGEVRNRETNLGNLTADANLAAARAVDPAVTVSIRNSGGIRDSTRVVIRDVATLGEYWRQATSTQVAPPPVPTVDFNREMAILVAAGRRVWITWTACSGRS
jgi:hypothetical protein